MLERVGGSTYATDEIAAVKQVLAQEEGSFGELFSRSYRLPLLIALVLMVGSQFSGINAIMYYSTEIFKNATGNADAAFSSSVWIGLVNLVATFIAIGLVDKAGRRPLLLIGNAIQVVALVTVGFILRPQPAFAGAAGVRHPLHRRLCDGHGAAALDRLFRDLPRQAPRAAPCRWPRSASGPAASSWRRPSPCC